MMGDVEIRDDPERERFVFEDGGAVAKLEYRATPGILVLVHTEVPESMGGRGVGGRLVRAAVDRAAREGATLVPWCPFARRWLQEHPDEAATVTIDWTEPPGARRGGSSGPTPPSASS